MKEIILLKEGEIALKGLNRATFEDILVKNVRYRLKDLGKFKYTRAQSTIYVRPEEDTCDMDEAVERIKSIFGIAAFSRAAIVEKDFEYIKTKAVEYVAEELENARTFKVEAKRSDKSFPMKTPEITRELGGYLLSKFHHLKVDVHNPDVVVMVEIRDFAAYVYAKRYQGAGGLPVGSGGKAMLLLSGGIDSPVAGYMMAKRGLKISAIHFISPPYTSDRAKQKVEELCELLTPYCGDIQFYCVPFTKIQEEIREHCPEEFFTIIMRRLMMKIAQKICAKNESQALITGESVGQVASQTLHALATTDAVCEIPVLRPLIGMDKTEIIAIANQIGTFETSIQPYEDCCTVFTPKHPKTRPQLKFVELAESKFDFEPLLDEAVENTTMEVKRMELY
ncbi:tRNA uracil 4-sulfurtransferase ThiI [Massilioclostridium coli]|uniref:tRNA uracil 4-sulfurtransferase ThiI n=1 Tax=Massilioclostridium coli TaxID=1870991 RepID=UPI00085C503B|nr:tRNA uracil 4-sulfurtransferase ThiI [Massilioclostridium coli]